MINQRLVARNVALHVLALAVPLFAGLSVSRLGCVHRLEEEVLTERTLQIWASRPPAENRIVVVDLGNDFIKSETEYRWTTEEEKSLACERLTEARIQNCQAASREKCCGLLSESLLGGKLCEDAHRVVETRSVKCAQLAQAIERLFLKKASVVVLDLLIGPSPRNRAMDSTGATHGTSAAEAMTYCGDLLEKKLIKSEDPKQSGSELSLGDVIRRYRGQIVLSAVLEVGPKGNLRPPGRLVLPHPRLLEGDGPVGLTNMPETEQVVRTMPVCLPGSDQRTYCGLGVEAARRFLGSKRVWSDSDAFSFAGRRLALEDGELYYTLHRLKQDIPLERVINSNTTISNTVDEKVRNKIVFLGARRPSILRDGSADWQELKRTPFSGAERYLSGVEVHALVAATLLSGRTFRALPFWQLTILLCLGLLLPLLIGRYLPVRYSLLLGLPLLVGFVLGLVWLRVFRAWYLPVIGPGFSAALAYFGGIVLRLSAVSLKRLQLWLSLRHHLDRSGMAEVLKRPQSLEVSDQPREVTLMFSDVRDFSALAEKVGPREVIALIQEWLTAATECVTHERGYVENYLGDGFMSLFGAPVFEKSGAEQVRHACQTGLAMIQSLAELNSRWRAAGRSELRIGIGINTGFALVGDMGTRARFHYTAVGDCVNLGSRIEGLNKIYGTTILVGERTRELASAAFRFREIDLVKVVGRERPERIFELLGEAGGPESLDPTLYAEGLAHYRAGAFVEARTSFGRFLAAQPEDGPARLMLSRLAELEARAPEGWNGVSVLTTK
jgi:class 3 adenylate cyclase